MIRSTSRRGRSTSTSASFRYDEVADDRETERHRQYRSAAAVVRSTSSRNDGIVPCERQRERAGAKLVVADDTPIPCSRRRSSRRRRSQVRRRRRTGRCPRGRRMGGTCVARVLMPAPAAAAGSSPRRAVPPVQSWRYGCRLDLEARRSSARHIALEERARPSNGRESGRRAIDSGTSEPRRPSSSSANAKRSWARSVVGRRRRMQGRRRRARRAGARRRLATRSTSKLDANGRSPRGGGGGVVPRWFRSFDRRSSRRDSRTAAVVSIGGRARPGNRVTAFWIRSTIVEAYFVDRDGDVVGLARVPLVVGLRLRLERWTFTAGLRTKTPRTNGIRREMSRPGRWYSTIMRGSRVSATSERLVGRLRTTLSSGNDHRRDRRRARAFRVRASRRPAGVSCPSEMRLPDRRRRAGRCGGRTPGRTRRAASSSCGRQGCRVPSVSVIWTLNRSSSSAGHQFRSIATWRSAGGHGGIDDEERRAELLEHIGVANVEPE